MTKRALIVAIDNYTYQLDITGNINAGNLWKTYFLSKGYTVSTLYNTAATKTAIMSKLNTLTHLTTTVDTLAVVLLGHGGQFSDNGTDEVDRKDEVFAPVNTTLAGSNAIRDDELKSYLSHVATGSIVEVVVDACHSGTMIDRTVTSPNTLWASCLPTQLSGAAAWNGIPYATFSYILVYYLNNAPTASRQEMIEGAVAELIGWGILTQTPQLECTDAKKAGVPFT